MAATDLLTPDWLGYIPRLQSTYNLLGVDYAGYPNSSPGAPNPRKVQPSFGTSGIPNPTTISPPNVGGGAAGVAGVSGTGVPPISPNYTGAVPSGAPSYSVGGPFSTLTNVKNPAIDQRLAEILKKFDVVSAQTPDEFVNRLKAAQPQFGQFTQQDIGTLGDISGPGMEQKLADLRAGRRTATMAAVHRSLGDLARILSLGKTASTLGSAKETIEPSSYLQKIGSDTAAGIETQAALDEANQSRADLDYLNQLRLGTLGKRGDLLQTDISRSLLPSQATGQWYNNLAQSLLPLVGASNQNTFYGLQGPGQYIGDTYGGIQGSRLQDLTRIDTANRAMAQLAEQARQANMANALAQQQTGLNYDTSQENQSIEMLKVLPALKAAGLIG